MRITAIVAGCIVLFFYSSCSTVDTPYTIPIACISTPDEFVRIVRDSLLANHYMTDSTGSGFIRSFRWFNDGLSSRKVMVSLRYDTTSRQAEMTVFSTIQFRGTESTVNYTETRGFPGSFRTDFYPLLASLRSYCNSTLPPPKKKRRPKSQ